jgi:hypothetical protein
MQRWDPAHVPASPHVDATLFPNSRKLTLFHFDMVCSGVLHAVMLDNHSRADSGAGENACVEPNAHRNYVMQWYFKVQRELAPRLTAVVGYVGSRGVRQAFRVDNANIVMQLESNVWDVHRYSKDIFSDFINVKTNGPPTRNYHTTFIPNWISLASVTVDFS